MQTSQLTDPSPVVQHLFDALRNKRRRIFIRAIARADTLTAKEAANHIALAESDTDSLSDLDNTEAHSVYVAVQQSHLPKLCDLAVLRHDRDTKIQKGPHFQAATTLLQCVDDQFS